MKEAKKAAAEDKKGQKAPHGVKKNTPSLEQKNGHSAKNQNGLDLKAIKSFAQEVKNQRKLLKEIQRELKAIGSRVGAK